MEPGEVDRREREHAFVVEKRPEPPQRIERVDEVLEHVEDDYRVGASGGSSSCSSGFCSRSTPKRSRPISTAHFEGSMPRALQPARLAARNRPTFEPTSRRRLPADEVPAHDPQDPFEKLAPAFLLGHVVLVHDFA